MAMTWIGNRMFPELMIWQKHHRARFNREQRRLLQSVATRNDLRINLACGLNQRQDWINVDITWKADVTWDLRRGLPFDDNCAEVIFCEHYLEHVDLKPGACAFVAECQRVLRPGGILRLIVPDIKKLVAAYVRDDREWFEYIEPNRKYLTSCDGLMHCVMYDGDHKSGWDYETLQSLLNRAGFVDIQETDYGVDASNNVAIESPSSARAAHSLCVNARKS